MRIIRNYKDHRPGATNKIGISLNNLQKHGCQIKILNKTNRV